MRVTVSWEFCFWQMKNIYLMDKTDKKEFDNAVKLFDSVYKKLDYWQQGEYHHHIHQWMNTYIESDGVVTISPGAMDSLNEWLVPDGIGETFVEWCCGLKHGRVVAPNAKPGTESCIKRYKRVYAKA